MVKVCIFNVSTRKTEYKKFRTEEDANLFFDTKYEKNKERLVCEPRDKFFTYYTYFGNKVMVQKMY